MRWGVSRDATRYEGTANPRRKSLELQGFDSFRILSAKGWDSKVHRGFPRYLDSEVLSFCGFLICGARRIVQLDV